MNDLYFAAIALFMALLAMYCGKVAINTIYVESGRRYYAKNPQVPAPPAPITGQEVASSPASIGASIGASLGSLVAFIIVAIVVGVAVSDNPEDTFLSLSAVAIKTVLFLVAVLAILSTILYVSGLLTKWGIIGIYRWLDSREVPPPPTPNPAPVTHVAALSPLPAPAPVPLDKDYKFAALAGATAIAAAGYLASRRSG